MKNISEAMKEFKTNEKPVNEKRKKMKQKEMIEELNSYGGSNKNIFVFDPDSGKSFSISHITENGPKTLQMNVDSAWWDKNESVDEAKTINPLSQLDKGSSTVLFDLLKLNGIEDVTELGKNAKAKKKLLDDLDFAKGVLEKVIKEVHSL